MIFAATIFGSQNIIIMRNRNYFNGDYEAYYQHRQRNRRIFGAGLAVIGILLFLKALGVLSWLSFTMGWPVILIIIGLLLGIKSGFRNNAWWILTIIGAANITPEFMIMGKPSTHFIWPLIVIVCGLSIAFRPKRSKCYPKSVFSSTIGPEGDIDINVTFGGKKEVITSKDFKGGTVEVTFAGCELNLSQADFVTPTVILDFKVSFGGVEMVVPSHWEIQNEISPSFGSVEDERTIQTNTTFENKKTLILRGNCSFGSIEIKSY